MTHESNQFIFRPYSSRKSQNPNPKSKFPKSRTKSPTLRLRNGPSAHLRRRRWARPRACRRCIRKRRRRHREAPRVRVRLWRAKGAMAVLLDSAACSISYARAPLRGAAMASPSPTSLARAVVAAGLLPVWQLRERGRRRREKSEARVLGSQFPAGFN